MVCNHLKELKVKHIEARGVILGDLNLFEQRLAQDGDRNVIQFLEQIDEMFQHHVTNLYFPVKFNKNES